MQNKLYIKMLFVFVTIWISLLILSSYYTLGINTTDSLDTRLFVIKKGQFPSQRGQLIVFNAPDNQLHKEPFVKIVGGIAGDLVHEKSRDFFINEIFAGRAKEFSKTGEKAELGFTGVIPKGCYFVYSKHKDSYDSKYKKIGLVCVPHIIGTAYPLF